MSSANEGLFKYLIKRTTLANFVAAGVVIAGTIYFLVTKDVESMKWLVAIGTGWLFANATAKRTSE